MTNAVHPWRLLREQPNVTLTWHTAGPWGYTNHSTQTISIRTGLDQAQRRCTLLHELQHIHRGPVTWGMAPIEETRVRKITAHLLLPNVKEIADAYAWALGDDHEAAAELWVATPILLDRMRWMNHPAERSYLALRFSEDNTP